MDNDNHNLSMKHGGGLKIKTYCRYYYQRPREIGKQILCTGFVDAETSTRLSPICADYVRCLHNGPMEGEPKEKSPNGLYFPPTLPRSR